MPAAATSGTHTSDGNPATIVNARTTPGTYVLVVDTVNMDDGDILELWIETKTLAGSTSATAYYASYANAQAEKVKYSIPVPVTHEVTVKIKATAGDDYPWELIAL